MKKICFLLSIFVVVFIFSSCSILNIDLEKPVEIDDKNVENRTISELLNLSDSLEFASNDLGYDFLINDEEIVNKFSNNDFYIRFGKYEFVDSEDRRKSYDGKILEWTDEEKNYIIKNIMTFENYFFENNITIPKKIYMFKVSDDLEYGEFFVRDNAIFIPEKLINGFREDLQKAIVKSIFYILVDSNQEKYERLCNAVGFYKTSELIFPKEYLNDKFTYENSYKNDFYIKSKYKDVEFDFMPISYFLEKYDGNNVLEDVINKYIAVNISDSGVVPLYLDEDLNENDDGKLLEVNLNELNNYYTSIGNNSSLLSNPKEILADNFAIAVLNRKANNKRILDKIVSIMKN